MGIQTKDTKKSTCKHTASRKRKWNSKKDRTNTCGCSKPLPTTTTTTTAASERQRLYVSIFLDESFFSFMILLQDGFGLMEIKDQ